METYQIIIIVVGSILLIGILVFYLILNKIYNDIFKGVSNTSIKDDIEFSYDFAGISVPNLEPIVKKMVHECVSLPHEDVYITSFDKLKLHGVIYRFGDNNAPVVLCFHGYKGNKFRDFMGAIKIYQELKYNVILVDQRAQKESEGRSITFGVKESKDVISWINKAKEIFGEGIKISLEGLSMGGGTVLFAAAYRSLPDNVKCISTDCPVVSPMRIFAHSLEHLKLPRFLIYYTSVILGGLFMGVNFNKYDALKGLKDNKLPILIIHGRKDEVVPIEETIALKEKYPNFVQLEVFDNSNHALSYFEDTQRYHQVSKDFLIKYLNN